MDDDKNTLIEHVSELRSRIIKSLLFLIICLIIVFNYVGKIIPFLIRPVGKLVFIAPQDAFIANLKVAFFLSLLLSSPFIVYQIWKFVSAGLKANEKKYVLIFGPMSLLFFILGSSFGYLVVIPLAIRFFLGFSTELISPMISVSGYISFVGSLVLAFGIVFQIPLVILFLTKIGVVTPKFLSTKRKHAVVLILIAAATLTPPDVITQCFMAVPLMLLYETGIIFSKIAYKKDE